VIGWFTDRYVRSRSFTGLMVMMVFGIGVIHLFGVIQLAAVLHVSVQIAIEKGSLPFIAVDVYKAMIAAAIAAAVTPGTAYGDEIDP